MIDFNLIAQSINHYQKLGYERIETPWTVSKSVDDLTRPSDRIPFQLIHNNKCLVGSGEQSFLYLALKGFLPKGKYQTVTPCFRYEDFDELHTKYFIKNELIVTDDVNDKNLQILINDALSFFSKFFSIKKCENMLSVIEKEDDSFDIVFDGYELGSYGIRSCSFLTYIYGTACAEPRLSTIFNMY